MKNNKIKFCFIETASETNYEQVGNDQRFCLPTDEIISSISIVRFHYLYVLLNILSYLITQD